MSGGWADSTRRQELPSDWPDRRETALQRDGYRCTQPLRDGGGRCPAPATDVDHIKHGNDHSLANLASLCSWHHNQKSAREGQAARTPPPPLRRPPERHPGLL